MQDQWECYNARIVKIKWRVHIYWRLICRSQQKLDVLCIWSCEWFHWTGCPLFLSLLSDTFCSLSFAISFLHLVQSQNDCYKVCSSRSWLTYCFWHSSLDGMFHNKERDLTSDIFLLHWHWEEGETGRFPCWYMERLTFHRRFFSNVPVKDWCVIVVQFLSAHGGEEWNISTRNTNVVVNHE